MSANAPGTNSPLGEPTPGPEERVPHLDLQSAALAALPVGVVVQSGRGEIVSCNPAAERILGLTREQMAGRTSLDPAWRAIHEDGSPFPGESHPAMMTLRTGEACRDVMMGVHKPGGELAWLSVSSEPIPGPDGHPGAVTTAFVDVTARVGVEERYQALFHEMLNGFALHEIICDAAGRPVDYRFLAVNPAFERTTGLKSERIVGRTVLEVMPGTERRWIETYGRVALTGEPVHFESFSAELGKHFEVTAYRPAPGQFACIFADVTERKAAEDGLRVKEAAIASSISGIAISDLTARVTYVNDAFVRMWGFGSAGEVVGMSIPDFVQDPAAIAPAVDAVRTTGSWIGEFLAKRKDGGTFPALLAANRADDEGGHPLCLLASFLDISEQRNATERIYGLNAALEQRVRQRTAELETANRELDGFSYSISHDLRAPLRAIEGFSAIVARDHEERLDPEIQRLLGLVRTNARRMSGLIDDLLTFSRSSRTEVRHGRVEMTAVVLTAFREVVEGAGAEGKIDFRLGELPDVEGDVSLLRQVWVNLLSNAVKYSAKRDDPVVEVEGTVEGGSVRYRVRDNGVGFDMAYAPKLFGVFQRLHGISEFEGTGIGLALVKRIVERHGGRVWAEGELGRGATFSFSLPREGRRWAPTVTDDDDQVGGA